MTFGDGTTQNYVLPWLFPSDTPAFWGIHASQLISTIGIRAADGTVASELDFVQDNLTIGVPEPSPTLLLGAGILFAARHASRGRACRARRLG